MSNDPRITYVQSQLVAERAARREAEQHIAELERDLEYQTEARIQDAKDNTTNFHRWKAAYHEPLVQQLAAERERAEKAERAFAVQPTTLENESFREALRSELIKGALADLEKAERERDEMLRERDDAHAVIVQLRAINVEPGISLGKAYEWRRERDALAAHVERLREALYTSPCFCRFGQNSEDPKWECLRRTALAATPTDSEGKII